MMTKNIAEYRTSRKIAVLKKKHAPTIIICTKDQDMWLLDIVKYHAPSGLIIEDFGINASQLGEYLTHMHGKGYQGLVRNKFN